MGNPKKAAILGLLCVVALWFWSPLVWGWVAPKSRPEAGTPASKVAAVQHHVTLPSATGGPVNERESTTTHPNWQQIAEWMERDPQTRPVALARVGFEPRTEVPGQGARLQPMVGSVRDPFRNPLAKEQETESHDEDPDEELPPAPLELTPQDTGATVTGIVAGLEGGAAMINGRTYIRGDKVILRKDGMPYDFDLADVQSWGVVLTRDGKRYELGIPTSAPRETASADGPAPALKP